MSHFYGTLKGQAGEATRRGSKRSGLVTYAASWAGAIRVELSVRDDMDYALVSVVPWRNRGTTKLLYDGPLPT